MNRQPFPAMPGEHFDGSTPWLHGVFMLVALAIVVVGIILVARMLTERRPGGSLGSVANREALHELDLRYARGDVAREDYLTRRADLLSPGAHPPVAPPAAETGSETEK